MIVNWDFSSMCQTKFACFLLSICFAFLYAFIKFENILIFVFLSRYEGSTSVGSMSEEYRWCISGRPERFRCHGCTWNISLGVWPQGKCYVWLLKLCFCLTGWFGMVIMALVTSNNVQLRQARLVLGLVTTFGGATIPVFSGPTQPGHHFVSRCTESYLFNLAFYTESLWELCWRVYWLTYLLTFGYWLGRNGKFCTAVGRVTRTAGILAYCMLA